jgi:hypothetical protein
MNESPEAVLINLTAAWRSADPERIGHDISMLYADNAVVATGDGTRAARGRDAIVNSYVAFARDAKMLDVKVDEPVIDRFEAVAVATMQWSMTYAIGGAQSSESGSDVYVLRRVGEFWRIYWREVATRPLAASPSP